MAVRVVLEARTMQDRRVDLTVHRHHVDYLVGQLYLEPHPKELMLRNHV